MSTEQTVPMPDLADPADDHAAPAGAPGAVPITAPRTRWAAIIWGAFFVIVAWTGIWMLGAPGRRDGVTDWFASLDPGMLTASALLVAGVLVLVTGLVGLFRRAQRQPRSTE